jgi:hypothetical protein
VPQARFIISSVKKLSKCLLLLRFFNLKAPLFIVEPVDSGTTDYLSTSPIQIKSTQYKDNKKNWHMGCTFYFNQTGGPIFAENSLLNGKSSPVPK